MIRHPTPASRFRLAIPSLRALRALPLLVAAATLAGPAAARAAWTRPSFPGDGFVLPLPPRAVASWSPDEARAELVPLLRAAGFARATDLGLPGAVAGGPEPPDLPALAAEVCREELLRRSARDRALCALLAREPVPPSDLGREASAWAEREAASLSALARSAPREEAFPQLVGGVPIEGAGVFVRSVPEGGGGEVRFAYGTLFDRFAVANRPALPPLAAVGRARRGLLPRTGLACACAVTRASDRIDLVLLPTRTKPAPELRYAYRTLLQAAERRPGGRAWSRSWMVWIDAESGALLRLQPQFADLEVKAPRFRRDPSTPLIEAPVRVEAVGEGPGIELRYGRVFGRLDLGADGDFGGGEVAGDPALLAALGSPTPRALRGALCSEEGGSALRQVNAYAHLYRFWRIVTAAGAIDPFPEKPIAVWIDIDDEDGQNQAQYDFPAPPDLGLGAPEPDASILWFAMGAGSGAERCPDEPGKRLNGALDATTLTHELAHLAMQRLHERRPLDWCGSATCPLPNGRWTFHDFADAFAGAYASTDCMSGWTDKNAGGEDPAKWRTDQGLGCRGGHSEGGRFPRLANELDRFPEHRALAPMGANGYADGQIAAGALWFTREGLRSRSLAAGSSLFWVLLNRALRAYGFLAPSCDRCDRDVYRYLQALELQLLAAAAPPGSSLAGREAGHEIVNGFARAGLFLVPLACLDGDPATGDADACPLEGGGESGGDAIVDLDDNEPGDDATADGVLHRESDFLRRDGPAPTFEVWTGPLFRFAKDGSASTPPSARERAAPCNDAFQVEAGADPALLAPVRSGWRPAGRTGGGCRGSWTPTREEWDLLRGAARGPDAETRIYYRVTTRSGEGKNVRVSTEPGNGRFRLPPASAIVNATGTP